MRTISILAILISARALGQTFADETPKELEGVGIGEHLDEQIPGHLVFTDEQGREVRIEDYLGERPVIFTLNSSRCPILGSLTRNGLVDGITDMEWTCGEQYEIVTVSISPDEGSDIALQNKRGYVARYGRDEAHDGWHFLTGSQQSIKALAEALGFGYRFEPRSGEYLHTASIMFVTPSGRISKYMNDVRFAGRDLRFALIEASEGRIGTAMDRLLLFNCFQYDPDAASYTPNVWKLMRLSAVMTMIVLVIGLIILGRSGRPGSICAPSHLSTGGAA